MPDKLHYEKWTTPDMFYFKAVTYPEFFWDRPVHILNQWLASSGEIFKICAARYLKMHFLALSVLRLSCKTFPNYLSLHYKTLFFMDYLKKNSYSNKNLFGYKLLRAAKRSQLKRCN